MENTTETYEKIMAPDPVEEVVSTSSNDVPEVKESNTVQEDLVWDDDEPIEDPAPDEEETIADEDADEEELQKIEAKNKWMKERLAPTKQKLTKAEEEIAKLRSELESIKSNKAPEPVSKAQETPVNSIDEYINTIPEIVEIDRRLTELKSLADKGEITEGDYVDQRTELLTDKKVLKRDIVAHIQNQQKAVVEQEAKIAKDFESTVLAKKEVYPNIDRALSRVNKNAINLNIDIRRALIIDDETNGINSLAPDLINIIGNDKKALGYLIAQSKLAEKTGRTPVAALEYIGRLKSRIQSESVDNMKAPDEEDSYVAPKKAVPKTIRNTPAGGNPVDLSTWARDAVKRGERPW